MPGSICARGRSLVPNLLTAWAAFRTLPYDDGLGQRRGRWGPDELAAGGGLGAQAILEARGDAAERGFIDLPHGCRIDPQINVAGVLRKNKLERLDGVIRPATPWRSHSRATGLRYHHHPAAAGW